MSSQNRASAWSAVALPAALLLAAAPAPAQQPSDDTVSVTAKVRAPRTVTRTASVAYADLDLATARGQHRLERRIEAAADTVCADAGQWDRFAWQDQRQCLDGAVTTALAQVRGVTGAGTD